MRPRLPSERFHEALYSAIQLLRRRPLARYIRQLERWERLDSPGFARLRAARLARTLGYAKAHVPLYGEGEWREALHGRTLDLRAWPVLTRETLQTRFADLLARPPIRGTAYRTTSGSTGQPLRVATDPAGAAWAWAGDYRGLLWYGIRMGDRSVSLRPRTEGSWAEWVRNRYAVPATDLSDERLAAAVRHLQTGKPRYVWGYTSAVVELARHARLLLPNAPRPLVPYAKVFGEMLYPFQRRQIEEGLGARVISTYGCNETGTAGYECPAGSLHIFADHIEVEIMRDGERVEPGEMGDIVLTCTTNRAMPLIRYRVGDRGRLLPDPCVCGRHHPVLADIEGRVGDLLLTAGGERVHGTAALGQVLKQALRDIPATAIARVLFEQHDRLTWTALVQPGPGFDDGAARALVDGVRAKFGAECRVTVQTVTEIPREPSGKFRFYRAARG